MTRPTRKADPRIERIVRQYATTISALAHQHGHTDEQCRKVEKYEADKMLRRLRAFERAALREAADRAATWIVGSESHCESPSCNCSEVLAAAVRAAIENRRKP